MAQVDLFEMLHASGVDRESVVPFDVAPTPRHIRYVDLLPSMGGNPALEVLPDAVIETAGSPVMYVVRQDRLGDSTVEGARRLAELVRVLACRADARFLAVVRPGCLNVYSVTLSNGAPQPVLSATGESVRAKLRGLLSGAAIPLSGRAKRTSDAANQWLETLLFKLLSDAAHQIKRSAQALTVQQVIGLVGRALFFRFLVDRRIVGDHDAVPIAGQSIPLVDVFSTPERLASVCYWMDRTFNGDLLSLSEGDKNYEDFVEVIGPGIQEVCNQLSNIQHKSVGGQLPLDWGVFSSSTSRWTS